MKTRIIVQSITSGFLDTPEGHWVLPKTVEKLEDQKAIIQSLLKPYDTLQALLDEAMSFDHLECKMTDIDSTHLCLRCRAEDFKLQFSQNKTYILEHL